MLLKMNTDIHMKMMLGSHWWHVTQEKAGNIWDQEKSATCMNLHNGSCHWWYEGKWEAREDFAKWGNEGHLVSPRVSLCGRFDMATGFELGLFPAPKGRNGHLLVSRQLRRIPNRLPQIDVFYCPDPDSAAIAVKLATKHRARVIFDIHEKYCRPEAMHYWGREPHMQLLIRLILLKLQLVCLQCDLVIGVSDFVVSHYKKMASNQSWFVAVRLCRPHANPLQR